MYFSLSVGSGDAKPSSCAALTANALTLMLSLWELRSRVAFSLEIPLRCLQIRDRPMSNLNSGKIDGDTALIRLAFSRA